MNKVMQSLSANTMERKEFMKKVGMSVGGILLLNCIQACTPSDDSIPDPNPNPGTGGKVDFTLDLNESANTKLNTKGGALVKNGIIIARTLDDDILAVASACTHAGTTIDYRPQTNDFWCSPNKGGHGSEFNADGSVKKNPATAALKKYNHTEDKTAKTIRIFE